MDIPTRKIEFVQEFLKLQSEEVIVRFWKGDSAGTNEGIEPMSIVKFNERIDKSMNDSKNGRLIKGNDLKAKIEKWS